VTELPSRARVVIIGGGVGGTSVAYHLGELGERDVVLVERAELTSGSTFHSAGLVGQLRADPTLTRMNRYSAELYARLQQTDTPPGWVPCGGIRLACTPERMEETRRQIGWAASYDIPLVEISVGEAVERFPLMDPSGVIAASYLPTDGYVDPSQLTMALAAGARRYGVRIHTGTRVTGIGVDHGRVSSVRTDRGDIEAEVVVNCGGMFAAEIGRLAGVRVPIVPMSHQYLVTTAFRSRRDGHLPTLRDPDLLVYYREEVDGLLMGGYERRSRPWGLASSGLDRIPEDFNNRLIGEDWDRFEEILVNAQVRVPSLADVGIRKLINGPEAFTPDNEFCLGETQVGGFFVAAGFCAHGIAGAGGIGKVMAEWIVGGEPELDVWSMDIRRFADHYRSPTYTLKRTVENYETYYDIKYPNHERLAGRPLRVTPVHTWHVEHGAAFGEKAGWERVNYFAPNATLGNEHSGNDLAGDTDRKPWGWAGHGWSPAIGAEHAATRSTAGLFDESSFAKIAVSGLGAAAFLERVCDNRVAGPVGKVTYTQALNPRGGIESDFTVTRLADDEFVIVTGTALGDHDLGWLRRHAPGDGSVRLRDITGQLACFALWGPAARTILGPLTPQDLSNAGFPFMTSRETTVGDVPVRGLRVTFVGELGWELYCSAEYGLAAAGYKAIDSLRLEKGYRVWGSDVTPNDTPFEAGLDFCVRLDKPGGFIGRDALAAQRDVGPRRRLRGLLLDDGGAVVLGNEPIRMGDEVVGRVTSGGYGYTVGRSIAYGYLPVDRAQAGERVEVGMFGRWVEAVVADDPLFDRAPARPAR
jgi:glycine cleavage system aminomethyltransferase T/glycine/D-amino acid oxidase-like deaminating enzyme